MSDAAQPAVSRGLLIALGAVAVAALLFFVVVRPLLFTTDDEPVAAPPPDPDPVPDVVETEEPEAEPVPETFEVFSARDPFQQLAEEDVPDADPSPEDPDDPADPPPDDPPDPGAPPPPPGDPTNGVVPPTDPDTGEPADPPDVTVGATRVRLIEVFTDDDGTDRVLVTVNGTGYRVAEGQTFAERLRLLDIAEECGTFLFGDSRFTLCAGEQIRK